MVPTTQPNSPCVALIALPYMFPTHCTACEHVSPQIDESPNLPHDNLSLIEFNLPQQEDDPGHCHLGHMHWPGHPVTHSPGPLPVTGPHALQQLLLPPPARTATNIAALHH